jgi:hypothetical protein
MEKQIEQNASAMRYLKYQNELAKNYSNLQSISDIL